MSINTEMTALADAIRDKSGVTGKLSISGMTVAVNSITVGEGGEDIDLSFVTASAGDILSGKVGADTAGNPVYGNIPTVTASSDGSFVTIPAGFHASEQRFPITVTDGGGYDTSSVTATADTMLSGVIAIGKNGETITGNIATVTPTVNKNTFSVGKGYVETAFTETIAEATVTETEDAAIVSPGYVGEELRFDLSSGSDGEAAVCGYIDFDGNFQPVDLSGDVPVDIGEPEPAEEVNIFLSNPAFCMTAKENGTEIFIGASAHPVDTLYARKNGGEWEQVVFTPVDYDTDEDGHLTHSQTFQLEKHDKLEFYNKSEKFSSGTEIHSFKINKDVAFSGNIHSLINFAPLSYRCFYALFVKNTELTTAPDLPATVLAPECYANMFSRCPKLHYLRVNFTQWSFDGLSETEEPTYVWLFQAGDATTTSTCVFSKPHELPEERGISRIPLHWTVENI